MEDSAILDLYFARNEVAIVETDRKYGIHTYMFNRIIDIETVASIIINGTEFSVE